jgi:hypothetical protein
VVLSWIAADSQDTVAVANVYPVIGHGSPAE